MPDYSVIQPIADTVDRRGQNYNLGVGDANTSALGAAVEGFSTGMTNSLNWSGEILRQRTEYDPDKLLQEQIQRELKTRELQAVVETAEKKLPFVERKELAGIEATEAGTSLTREQIRTAGVTADVAEKYGMEKARLGIQKTRAELDAAREKIRTERLTQAQKLYGKGVAAELRIDKDQMLQSEKVFDNRMSQWNKDNNELIGERDPLTLFKLGDAQAAQAAGKALTPEQERALFDAGEWEKRRDTLDQERRSYEQWYAKQNEKFGIMLPGAEPGEPRPTAAQERQAEYIQKVQAYIGGANEADAELEGRTGVALAEQGAYKANKRVATLDSIEEDSAEIEEALKDSRNVTAVQKSNRLATLAKGIEELPEGPTKVSAQNTLSRIVEKSGGVESLMADGADIRDAEEKAAWEESVIHAAVLAGKTDELPEMPRNMINAGLTPQHAAREQDTLKQIGHALANRVDQVDPTVQNLRKHPLMGLVSRVSQDNKDGFTISDGYVGENTDEDVYIVSNPNTGEQRQLPRQVVEGDTPEQVAQTTGLRAVLTRIGADNTAANEKSPGGNSISNQEAIGATYNAGVSRTTPQQRVAMQQQAQVEPTIPPVQLDSDGMVIAQDGKKDIPDPVTLPEISPSLVTTQGVVDGFLKYGADFGSKTPPPNIVKQTKKMLGGLADGNLSQGFLGLGSQDVRNVNELIDMTTSHQFDTLPPNSLAKIDGYIANNYKLVQRDYRLPYRHPSEIPSKQLMKLRRDIFDNSYKPKITQQIKSYADTVASKVAKYYGDREVRRRNREEAMKQGLKQRISQAEQVGDITSATLDELTLGTI